MNEHLMASVLYAALFFETSTEDECDPDVAVKQLEAIAFRLRELTPAEQDDLRHFGYRLADDDASQFGRDLRRLVDELLPPGEGS